MPDTDFLQQLADQLRRAPRTGRDSDEPEGSRYIVMSDTLAHAIADRLDPPEGANDG